MNQRKPARAIARKPTLYRDLPAGMRFKAFGESHEFVKLSEAQALDDITGKDAIFNQTAKCIPIRTQIGYHVLENLI